MCDSYFRWQLQSGWAKQLGIHLEGDPGSDVAAFRLPTQEAVLRRMREDVTLDRKAVVGDRSQKRSHGRAKGTVEERLKKTEQLRAQVAAGKKTGIDTTANLAAPSVKGLGRGNPGRPRRCSVCTAAKGMDVWLKECGGVRQQHMGRGGKLEKEQEAVMNQVKRKEQQLEKLRAHLASVRQEGAMPTEEVPNAAEQLGAQEGLAAGGAQEALVAGAENDEDVDEGMPEAIPMDEDSDTEADEEQNEYTARVVEGEKATPNPSPLPPPRA